MLNKLKEAEQRYCDIETSLQDPSVFSDNEKYTALMKEYKSLSPIIEKYREYKKAAEDNGEALALLEERAVVRKAKDWARADAIRDELKAMGFAVEDSKDGAKLKRL